MASRQFRSGVSFGSLVPNMRVLCGTVDGYGDTESINGVNDVSKPATGTYNVSLEDKYVELVCVQATLQKAGGTAKWVQVEGYDVTSSSPYIQLVVIDSTGAPVDLAEDEIIHLHITLRDSTVRI